MHFIICKLCLNGVDLNILKGEKPALPASRANPIINQVIIFRDIRGDNKKKFGVKFSTEVWFDVKNSMKIKVRRNIHVSSQKAKDQ